MTSAHARLMTQLNDAMDAVAAADTRYKAALERKDLAGASRLALPRRVARARLRDLETTAREAGLL